VEHSERAWIVPGFPLASEVIRRICGLSRPPMPLNQPALSAEEIDLVEAWIVQGARLVENIPASLPAGARVRLGGTVSSTWSLGKRIWNQSLGQCFKNPVLRFFSTTVSSLQVRRV
jgi:hypothetical protein